VVNGICFWMRKLRTLSWSTRSKNISFPICSCRSSSRAIWGPQINKIILNVTLQTLLINIIQSTQKKKNNDNWKRRARVVSPLQWCTNEPQPFPSSSSLFPLVLSLTLSKTYCWKGSMLSWKYKIKIIWNQWIRQLTWRCLAMSFSSTLQIILSLSLSRT